MGTAHGMSIRFSEGNVRSMGRSATGVKGITLDDQDAVIGMDVVDADLDVLIVTAKGYGKRTPVSDYRMQTRGGKGIKTINVTEKNGAVVSLKMVKTEEDLMIITSSGTLIRMSMDGISTMGRYTQGVKLIHIREEDAVATVSRIDKNEEEPDEDNDEATESGASSDTELNLEEGMASEAEADVQDDDSGSEE